MNCLLFYLWLIRLISGSSSRTPLHRCHSSPCLLGKYQLRICAIHGRLDDRASRSDVQRDFDSGGRTMWMAARTVGGISQIPGQIRNGIAITQSDSYDWLIALGETLIFQVRCITKVQLLNWTMILRPASRWPSQLSLRPSPSWNSPRRTTPWGLWTILAGSTPAETWNILVPPEGNSCAMPRVVVMYMNANQCSE